MKLWWKRWIDKWWWRSWAVYLYTKLYKSKDIDVIIDYGVLRELSAKYEIIKNDRLKKYEIRSDGFDIDIYLPSYSELAVPPADIIAELHMNKEGFTVPTPEALMMLKLGAIADRMESVKGQKDAIDILGLLFYSGLDTRLLGSLIKRYEHGDYARLLTHVLGSFDRSMLKYLNLNDKTFSVLRNRYMEEIKKTI